MYLDTMALRVFEYWSRSWTTSFTSGVEAATELGQSLADFATHQRNEWNRSVSAATAELRHTWTYFRPYHRLRHGGRAVLVTGGTGDIGTAICLRLADAGFLVIATYPRRESAAARQWQAARRRAGYDLSIVECDVARCDDCAKMASWIEGHYGHVDILVNCVGITRDDRKNWQTVLDTNLDSVFNVTRTVIAAMAERHFGRIITICTVNEPPGHFGPTDVAAAKAGMLGFTKSLARELADHGITVNTIISPGCTKAGMAAEVPEEVRKAIKAKLAKGRWSESEEIAAAVDFLAADTSGYITGTDIAVTRRRVTA